MPKPFDAATKHLLESDPAAWMAFADLAVDGPLAVFDTDLSTVNAAADGVYRVEGPSPWLAHFEFQSSRDAALGSRLLRYNVLLSDRHDLPVQTVVLLLRPEADGPSLTGLYQRRLPDGRLCHEFHYQVIRIWKKPVDDVLAGGLATLPLAPLADVSRDALPGVIRRVDERLSRETTVEAAATLWTAFFVLMGLRYPPEFTTPMAQGVRAMIDVRDSSFYRMILEEGRAEGRARGEINGAIQILMDLGRDLLGPPTPEAVAEIEKIADLDRVKSLSRRLLKVNRWDELLATP